MPRRAPQRVRPSLNASLRLLEEPSSWLNTDWLNPIKRICIRKVCKKEFVVTAPNQQACPECQDLHEQEQRHTYYVEVELPDIDRVYELHNAARTKRCPPKVEQCRICGKDFVKKRCQVTCDNPKCREQNKKNVRGKYDDDYRGDINAERREKRATDTAWTAEDNRRRREIRRANRDKINAAGRDARKKVLK
jgi:hypothetical protein